MEVCRKNNLTLNPEKMQFQLRKVSFFGHTWSDKGLSADPKIEAVKRMEIPQDGETMRSFLQLINYLNHFGPRLAELSNPLREIYRQKVESSLQELVRLPFNAARRKFPRTSLYHSTTPSLQTFYRQMHQKEDLEWYYYKTLLR